MRFFYKYFISLSIILVLQCSFAFCNTSIKNNPCIEAIETDSITVYIFLSETCPICQSVTLAIKDNYNIYNTKGITFIGLFPNQDMSTISSLKKFGRKYGLDFELKLDTIQAFTKELSATTTPQVFVVRNVDKKIIYKGKIDNSFEAIGKRRQVITEHYLQNTLLNIVENKPIEITETPAVGCFIIQ